MADRSPFLRRKKNPKLPGYSRFDSRISKDSGISSNTEETASTKRGLKSSTVVEDASDRVSISWENIQVFVENPRPSIIKRLCSFGKSENEVVKSKQILFNVSGNVEAGTLLAVMGASGAGKTTLMNVLAHRNIYQMEVRGTVEINNRPIGPEISSMSAYIQQEDLFVGTLTVREHLTFQAFLRMEKNVPDNQRKTRVEDVILQLGLTKCADTFIGIPGRLRGISGGEKKRLSFASEILTDPPLLFADEPTSGLDSFMAQSLITALQRLAVQGRTIICTIHQPSSQVYAMFNSILLLAEGRTAYLGPRVDAIQYFDSLGYPCPVNFNPADHFIRTLAIVPGDEENCRKRVQDICDVYSAREAEFSKPETQERQDFFREDANSRSPYKASWCRQFRSVFWRSWLTNKRDVLIFRIRFFQSIFIGLVTGIIFFQTTIDQDGIENIYGAFFFLVTSVSFSNISAVTFTFPIERNIFLREHNNRMYRTDIYFLSKTLAESPQFFLGPLVMITVGYWMVGLRPDVLRFLAAYGILALVSMAAVSFAYVISTISPTTSVSTALSGPLTLPLLVLGGFYIENRTIPEWLSWLRYLSWFNYGFEALVVNQWDNYGPIPCKIIPNNETYTSCVYNGSIAIEQRGLKEENLLIDIYALVAITVGFRLISFLFLLRNSYKRT